MKALKYFSFILISALLIPQLSNAQDEVTVPLSNPGEPGKLDIGMVRGTISVSGYSGDEVLIKYAGGKLKEDKPATRDGLRRISDNSSGFEVSESGNNVEISGASPLNSIDFDISVPQNFSLNLSVVQGGDITIENLSGEIEISNVNGGIILRNVTGSAVLNTVNGDITATFDRVEEDKPMAFSNLNGDIDVTLPANAQLSAKMKSEWGEVFTDFDMEINRDTDSVRTGSENGAFKISVNNWIYGDINGGGPEYLFKSMRGDIFIRKK